MNNENTKQAFWLGATFGMTVTAIVTMVAMAVAQ